MLVSEALKNHIHDLDKERLELLEKQKRTIGWNISIPIIVAIISGLPFKILPAFLMPAAIGAIISSLAYYANITSPFHKIKDQLKTTVLQDLMETFHPDVDYTFSHSKQDIREITKATGFFRANRYREEDVIQGKYNDVDFYMSEIHLSRKKKKSRVTLFDGLLFKIRIPDKHFPSARIQSEPGLLSKLFNEYSL